MAAKLPSSGGHASRGRESNETGGPEAREGSARDLLCKFREASLRPYAPRRHLPAQGLDRHLVCQGRPGADPDPSEFLHAGERAHGTVRTVRPLWIHWRFCGRSGDPQARRLRPPTASPSAGARRRKRCPVRPFPDPRTVRTVRTQTSPPIPADGGRGNRMRAGVARRIASVRMIYVGYHLQGLRHRPKQPKLKPK